ncbi:ribonuclease H family protein [Fervidibacillus albus]|uniref:Ribonuclease H n=1 Tax=Fervidibacillus albus TaxID=2980026 RepID=A0A9E8LWU0_9BACI|nr:ribonuclease H family protein [Fervidibacillus albus]WAA11016.1 ribonuclease H family protein [Fervidibacillus albus]
MGKKKYYVVWKGKKTGIFTSWDECKDYVLGVPGSKYKSFATKEEAEVAFKKDWQEHYENTPKNSQSHFSTFIKDSISVDAACSGNPGMMEYRGVYTKTGETLFHFGPILGTNNIGEFLGIVHALAYLKQKGSNLPIYSDSMTAIKWVMSKKANTSLARTKETEQVWQLIERAERWLATNRYENLIKKWETDQWGEIKADFGRK